MPVPHGRAARCPSRRDRPCQLDHLPCASGCSPCQESIGALITKGNTNRQSGACTCTLIYPGHDYIARNLAFTLDREPDNARAKELLPAIEQQDPGKALVTTLGLEGKINTFFRLTSPSVIRRLRESFPDLPDNPDPKTVFLKLRELRNEW
jgi:hypothetical protein